MLFEEDYDTALWLILKADKKNRKDITRFLLDMPGQVVDNIRAEIERVKNKEPEPSERPSDYYNVVCDKDPNYFYNFQVDDADRCLRISKEYYDGEHLEDVFELMLFPVGVEYAKLLENFEEEWLGTFTYNIKTQHSDKEGSRLVDCKESEYNIHKTPIGHFVSYSREILGEHEISIYKPVRLRKALKRVKNGKVLGNNKRD